jgi:hypothetical protein
MSNMHSLKLLITIHQLHPSFLQISRIQLSFFLLRATVRDQPSKGFQRLAPLLALRVLSTAYLHNALPLRVLIDVPHIPMWKSTRTSFFRRVPHTIRIDLYLQMRSYLPLTTDIPTSIWQQCFEIAQEHFNSSVGTNTYARSTQNSSPSLTTRLLL